MVKNHLKRIALPKTWDLPRKKNVFITRPYGFFQTGLPLSVIMHDMLHLTQSSHETKAILNDGMVSLDGKVVRDSKVPVVLMSTVSIKNDHAYRVLLNERGRLFLKKVTSTSLPMKVTSKTMQPGKKLQLGFHNGRTLITQDTKIKVNDTLILDGEKVTHLPLEKGATIYFIGGSNVGKVGTIEHIGDTITVKIKDAVVETKKENVFVIGKDKPVVDVV